MSVGEQIHKIQPPIKSHSMLPAKLTCMVMNPKIYNTKPNACTLTTRNPSATAIIGRKNFATFSRPSVLRFSKRGNMERATIEQNMLNTAIGAEKQHPQPKPCEM